MKIQKRENKKNLAENPQAYKKSGLEKREKRLKLVSVFA